ncbi:MAG TPA: hypothetical protein DEP60_02600 [Ruminococcaceae bacterium]|nr:hypothetical protein [Oscillospiraceae bacterium]
MPVSELTDVLRKLSQQTTDAAKPAAMLAGTVTSASPLKIRISQKLELDADFLILARAVTEYRTDITPSGGSRRPYTIHNALKIGSTFCCFKYREGRNSLCLTVSGRADNAAKILCKSAVKHQRHSGTAKPDLPADAAGGNHRRKNGQHRRAQTGNLFDSQY